MTGGPAQREAPPLDRIYFYLTEGCNQACRHCWISPRFDPDGGREPSLPVELFERAVTEAGALGLSGVKLTGGEPLLHPRFTEIIDIVRRRKLSLIIETNGLLLTEETAEAVSLLPERFVSVSLDGADADTHDRIRGVRGSFEKACRAVRLLAAADVPPQIIMSLMGENISQVERMVHLAEELGAASVKFNIIQPTGRGKLVRSRLGEPGVPELIALGRTVETKLAETTRLDLFFDYPPAFRPLRRIAREGGDGICGIFGILGVIAGGYYALCGIGEHVPELVFGRVGEDPLEEIWRDHHVLQTIREGLPDRLEGVCGRCLMKGVCLGACLAQNYYRTAGFWKPCWFCEKAEEAGLFPSSRLGAVGDDAESRKKFVPTGGR